jgi:nicotinate-nucleotide--dimethylbenzimidazole phosphoribosyltransferase
MVTLTLEMAQAHLDELAKPKGSLGRLEHFAARLAVTQQSLNPQTHPRCITLFAADHGVEESGVSAWPSAVTTAMMATIAKERASSNALARAANCDLHLIDVGSITPLTAPLAAFVSDHRIAAGTQNLAFGAAMNEVQFDAAWEVGAQAARTVIQDGCRILIAGEMGIGNTTPAACLTVLLTGTDAATATGKGAGADDLMRAHKQAIVDAAVAREQPLFAANPKAAIAAYAALKLPQWLDIMPQQRRRASQSYLMVMSPQRRP